MILNDKLAIERARERCDPGHIRLVFAYHKGEPTARSCSVSFTDSEGVTHAVEITASTLYEAAVIAMAGFRRHGFANATFGPATNLNVRVKAPEAAHVVSVGKVKASLDGGRQESGRAGREEQIAVSAHAVNGASTWAVLPLTTHLTTGSHQPL